MIPGSPLPLRRDDVVAVALPPGPRWTAIVAEAWEAEAAVLPIDSRLPLDEAMALLRRARPTMLEDGDGRTRIRDGAGAAGMALVIPSSGTRGEPRLVDISRRAVEAAVRASGDALGVTAGDRWLSCLPLAHIGGLLVLYRALLLGGDATVLRGFDPEAVAEEAAQGGAHTSLVPTMLVRLLATGARLDGLRSVLVGGAALPAEVAARAHDAGARAISTYGQTQSTGGVVYDGVPLPGVGMRVTADGEVELSGPTLMHGYRDEVHSYGADFTDDGWLRTGDAGEIDGSGRLHVSGRLADVIRSGGESIWPGEVEAVLERHPGVAQVSVLGVPDAEWGAVVVAAVVPADRGAPPSPDDLREFVAQRLARFKAPRRVAIVDSLPRTSLGKVQRAALAEKLSTQA